MMRRSVPILGARRVLNYTTQDDIDFWMYARDVARDTGRRIFGQLWMSDPSVEEILGAAYIPAISEMLNNVNPLKALFDGGR